MKKAIDEGLDSVVIYRATGEWPYIVKRWYSVFGHTEPVAERSIYGFPDLPSARKWVFTNFPNYTRDPLPPKEPSAVDTYMSPQSIEHARVYAPVLRRTVEIVTAEKGTTFGEAYERALIELKMQGAVPDKMMQAILTAAFRVVTHAAFPPAGIRAVMTDPDCVVCGAPWDANGPTCTCMH